MIRLVCQDRENLYFEGISDDDGKALWERGLRGNRVTPQGRRSLKPEHRAIPNLFRITKLPGWEAALNYAEIGPPDMALIEFVDAWMGKNDVE